ncbi:chaperonin 10-like protein [Lentinula raphanica]|nr:chaperonin 10-like protein [Lentinula raphanica]KAJ3773885.1 chaperonin 10-like protein [Lentinula raphanica]KAJ3822777.1 chaperonin 10-like protein [Lentinula raphanica]KAJ3965839.1 chaperonin 10-like protein [Lentinula raphanica]
MSKQVKAWAATSPGKTEPITLTRRAPDDEDVAIDIKYAGICHSDIHTIRNEWRETTFPLVVGHEIAGVVSAVGKNVTKFKVGDRVGVGCMVNSCRQCQNCHDGEEQYCTSNLVLTYNSKDPKDGTITQGGYSQYIVVDQAFVLSVPESIPLDKAAPLMCAGITMYSPLNHWNAGPGKRVGIIGFGGLGHMGVKLAKALGSEVTVFSQTNSKKELGIRLGADAYVATSEPDAFTKLERKFDIIINTVSAEIPLDLYLSCLRRDGTLIQVGAPSDQLRISPHSLYIHRIGVHGSMIGGIAETQKMLDLCGEKLIFPEIETIPASYINEAYERVMKSQVQFRFVIDISTM